MSDKCRDTFDKAGYWPNEVMWKAWQQSWAAATEDIEERAEQAYRMLESRKDAEIKRLNHAMLSIAVMIENDGDEHHAGAMLRSEMSPNVELRGRAL